MRRIVATVALVIGAAVAVAATDSGGGGSYRVDAIFDNASSLIPGNIVKIAGAPVGTVTDIRLTKQRKARVQMEVDPKFGDFRSDARCVIAPESLFIGEKFVQCQPGTPDAPALRASHGAAPTIPLDHNSSTVDLDLVLSTLRLPVRQRLSILFNELGAGLAGHPRELAEAVQRANPALQATNRVLRILDGDRATLRALVGRSDQVLAELAARRHDVQGFITHANQVSVQTAAHRDDLSEAVRRLPTLLDQLQPAAVQLGALARQATPAARELRVAAPDVTALLRDVEPVSRAGIPALAALNETAKVGRRAIRPARPVARRLARAATLLPPVVANTSKLLDSARRSGAVEGLLSFIYYTALSTSRFDSFSHILPAYGLLNTCIIPATKPSPACDAHFGGAAGAAPAGAGPRLLDPRRLTRALRRETAAERRAPQPTGGGGAGVPAAPGGSPAPAPAAPVLSQLHIPVLDYLFGR